ncbi:MAG: ferritin-like domain-containing protein [Chloracidobacterium sp.]|nr:ferritin-like domain-containing protein [Chloracidobacterium sp.]MDW8218320.1 ferritin-like domain-containing protein [Acidobacteriota bacterium]
MTKHHPKVEKDICKLVPPRRAALRLGLAAGVGAALTGLAAGQRNPRNADAALLNAGLALEHQAIAAYDAGLGTGLLKGEMLELARHFQSQHRAHRDLLTTEIRKLGATPVMALASYTFKDKSGAPIELKTAEEILVFALGLEAGAASAYLGLLPQLASKAMLPVIAGVACDESQHAAAIRLLLRQQPAPDAVVK